MFNMKTLLCLFALSATIVHSAVMVDKSPPRCNLNIGNIFPGDRLLSRSYIFKPAVANAIQSEDFIYRGNPYTRVSAIQATEQVYTQWANIRVIRGGLGQADVTLRAQSKRGYGYFYLIDIWGR